MAYNTPTADGYAAVNRDPARSIAGIVITVSIQV